MNTGSVVVRRSLGRQLRALRDGANKTSADVNASGIASKTKLQRIEAGSGPIKMADARALCWLYGADAAVTEKLAELALNTTTEGWWEDYGDVMPRWFGLYIELETAASSISTYDAELIHGLLQTPAYHRAVFEADVDLTPDLADREVKLRADRQKAAYDRNPPLQITAVLGEGALLRMVGGPEAMDEQRWHLRALSEQSNVDVYILPWNVGAHSGMKGAFTILGFDRPDDPDVVYVETLTGGRYVEQAKMLQRYRRNLASIQAQAITIKEYLE